MIDEAGREVSVLIAKTIALFCVVFAKTKVEKALESMEDEAERLYREERPRLLEDEAAATRDKM